jgi:hypothetical protein
MDSLHPLSVDILAEHTRPVAVHTRLVQVETADGWLVVSRSRKPKSVTPPYRYDYSYDHFDLQDDAMEFYGEIEQGEYGRSREVVAMVACGRGVPLGSKKVL